ncbi:hypothetical protein DL98DRAFT_586136 [Cadophora sp. DSE1049]|nr:hypothetical protein DL98DRAFT_586136 [Cadophora sp. DSE1049]
MCKDPATNLKLPSITITSPNLYSRQNIVLGTTVLDPFRPVRIPVPQWIPPQWVAVKSNPSPPLSQPPPEMTRSDGTQMDIDTPPASPLSEQYTPPTPQAEPVIQNRIRMDLTTPSPLPSKQYTSPNSPPAPQPAAMQALALAHLRSMTPELAETNRGKASDCFKAERDQRYQGC